MVERVSGSDSSDEKERGGVSWHGANSWGIQRRREGRSDTLHNQSETIAQECSGQAFLDSADCIYAGLEVRGGSVKWDWDAGRCREGLMRVAPTAESQGHTPRSI